jgi:hypothetical protein
MKIIGKKGGQDFHGALSKVFDGVKSSGVKYYLGIDRDSM